MVRASLNGFKALPPPGVDWRAVLNLRGLTTKKIVLETYRRLAAERHPDRLGGSHAMMAELNAARDLALREVAP